ncbi:BspA family leucine-rich repeat surface protein [Enterococcus faecalis]
MREMFYGCRSLTSLDISNFDTSQVTDMSKMFYGCRSLNSLDVSKFDTSQVTTMERMFEECISLSSLDVSKFDTSQVTTMEHMFEECISLSSLDVSNFNTSKVTTMYYMFSQCESLSGLDVSKFDTSQVTTMERMFSLCKSLSGLDVSKFDTSKVTNMKGMFYQCNNQLNLDVSKFDTSKVTDMNYMFYGCRSLTSIDVSGFDTSLVTNMSSMFGVCNSLSSLDVSNFNTSQVTNMGSMFTECGSLSDLDLSNFDTSQVTNMGSMFNRCGSLSDLNLSNFDTSQVTNMGSMFNRCSSLASLDIGKFDTSKVIEMNSMFEYSGISFIDLSNWKLNDSVKTTRMFYAGSTAKKNLLVIAKDPKLLNYGYGSFGYRPENILFNANGGSFSNGKTQLNYLKNVAITPEKATIDRVKEFARNNQPIRSKFMFGGWECAKQGDPLEHFTDFYSLIGKNYNAIWIPNNPNVPTGSILLPDSLNQLDLYYIPKGFIIPETELKDVEQQVITFRDGNGFHIAIRDQQSGKRWQLKASLKWDKQGLEDSYIQSGNTSGQVNKNNNNGQNLVQPSDYEEAPEISGVPNLKIGSAETCVMESKQGQGNGVYDFALNDATLVINNAKYTQPNEYTGNVNWNLESAP